MVNDNNEFVGIKGVYLAPQNGLWVNTPTISINVIFEADDEQVIWFKGITSYLIIPTKLNSTVPDKDIPFHRYHLIMLCITPFDRVLKCTS